jgi:hypothetical protein
MVFLFQVFFFFIFLFFGVLSFPFFFSSFEGLVFSSHMPVLEVETEKGKKSPCNVETLKMERLIGSWKWIMKDTSHMLVHFFFFAYELVLYALLACC